jgi:acyl carrier protein
MPAKMRNHKADSPLKNNLRAGADAKLGLKRKEVVAEIGRILRKDLEWNQPVRRDLRLAEDLHLDSMALLTLAAGLEHRFRIHLLEGDPIEISTVDDLARHIVELVRHREGGEKKL